MINYVIGYSDLHGIQLAHAGPFIDIKLARKRAKELRFREEYSSKRTVYRIVPVETVEENR